MASELLEVAVGSDKRGLVQGSQGGGKAVYVGDFVHCLQFSCFENLGNINGNYADRKLQKIGQRLLSRFLTVPLPGDVENLSQVHRRNQQRRIRPGFPE